MFNPQLNIPALRQAYAQNGAISIQNIFQPEFAEYIYQELLHLPWEIEIKDYSQQDSIRIPADSIKNKQTILSAIELAPEKLDVDNLFYIRKCVNIDNFGDGILREYAEAINSDTFLDPIREITGAHDSTRSWVEATCYEKCCFLGSHRDDHHPDNKVAFVFNLTKQWKLDWGGLLMIQFNELQPPTIVPPVWNSLSMFNVPVDHTVSCVSPSAKGGRYSLTGWLR